MAYEIDYIHVGDSERSGDAIALRFGNLSGTRAEQTVLVIDGGDKDAGSTLAEHIRTYYKTDQVDIVISTHPDADHASGLSTVLEEMDVRQLLMHRPWEHAGDIKDAFSDGRWTERGLGEKIEKSLRHANELETIANKKQIPILEPFQGVATPNGSLRVLGPSFDFYQSLLPHFRSTPATNIPSPMGGLLQKARETVELIEDRFDLDLLNDDEDTTSPENNSSTIILLSLDGRRLLFTGDAGKTALLHAANYAQTLGISLAGMEFLDVPHHGSRRNLSTKVLKRINASTAYISVSTSSPKHPAKKIINGLKKHGAEVFLTRGNTAHHNYNGIPRGWGASTPEPFYSRVEV